MAHHRRENGIKGIDMREMLRLKPQPHRWHHRLIDWSPILVGILAIALIATGTIPLGRAAAPAESTLAQLTAEALDGMEAPASAPATVPAVVPVQTPQSPVVYTVRKDDTFYEITAARGIKDWSAEAERIGLQCPEYLRAGWQITFAPGANTSLPCPGASQAQASPASTDGTDADIRHAYATTDPASGQQFTVQLVASNGGGKAKQAMNKALGKVGSPYRYGATGPNAFDCSGLVNWAFKQAGVKNLPRTSSALSRTGTPVSKSALQPGDLVFFYKPVSHVGIYIGNGKIVHASNKKSPVKVSDMSRMKFNSARRVA